VLYGLYTPVKTHFDNEEEVYLPLLDERLTPGEARRLFEEMMAAAASAATPRGLTRACGRAVHAMFTGVPLAVPAGVGG
jgi:hypothetical protein